MTSVFIAIWFANAFVAGHELGKRGKTAIFWWNAIAACGGYTIMILEQFIKP